MQNLSLLLSIVLSCDNVITDYWRFCRFVRWNGYNQCSILLHV